MGNDKTKDEKLWEKLLDAKLENIEVKHKALLDKMDSVISSVNESKRDNQNIVNMLQQGSNSQDTRISHIEQLFQQSNISRKQNTYALVGIIVAILVAVGALFWNSILVEKTIKDVSKPKGNLDSTLKYYEDALVVHKEIGDKQGEAFYLGEIGSVYFQKKDLDRALKYYIEALDIYMQIGYRQGEANQLGNIGKVYSHKGYLDKALKYYENALKISIDIGYKQGEANQLGNIGDVYMAMGNPEKALTYHGKALNIHRGIGDRQGEASDLGNIGLIYSYIGEREKALKYLNEALKILEKYNLTYRKDIFVNAIKEIETSLKKE